MHRAGFEPDLVIDRLCILLGDLVSSSESGDDNRSLLPRLQGHLMRTVVGQKHLMLPL